MKTYKILRYHKESKRFYSPVSGHLWLNGVMDATEVKNRDPKIREHWVWSCDKPDNPQLLDYLYGGPVLLVELIISGEIIINDNGVIQSEHAEIVQIVIDTPLGAYLHGKIFGPCDVTRKIASQDPLLAYKYAGEVDKRPHDVTRVGSSIINSVAFNYALYIDDAPHDVTRFGACGYISKIKDLYAKLIGKEIKMDDSLSSYYAVEYAIHIDKRFTKITEDVAKRDPFFLSQYKSSIKLGG